MKRFLCLAVMMIIPFAVVAQDAAKEAPKKDAAAYIQDLANNDPSVVIAAEKWLGDNKEDKATYKLLDLLKNNASVDVRLNASIAISQIGDKEVVDDLAAKLLSEENADVRYSVLLTISKLGIDSKEAYDSLVAAREKENDPFIKDYIAKMEQKFKNK